jgi:hypothetical protein
MAFPTTPILDDFNRTDGDPGANWIRAMVPAASPPQIESNRIKNLTADTTDSGMYWIPTRYIDSEIYITVPVLPSPSTEQFNLNWRTLNAARSGPPAASTNDWSGYRIIVIADGTVRVQKYDGTTLTQIGSDIASTCAAGDSFGAKMVGTRITVWRKPAAGVWGQIGVTLYDSTYPQSGYLALQMDEATCRLDDFGGGGSVGFPLFVPEFSSSFTGSDENPISEGGNWLTYPGWPQPARRVSNRMSNPTAGADYWSGIYKPTQPEGVFTDVEIIATIAAWSSSDYLSIDIRTTGAATEPPSLTTRNAYVFDTVGNDLSVARVQNGVSTQLGATVVTSFGAGDMIGIQAIGSLISFWEKVGVGAWTLILERVDTMWSQGRVSLGGQGQTWAWDDFTVGGLHRGGRHEYYDKLDRLK